MYTANCLQLSYLYIGMLLIGECVSCQMVVLSFYSLALFLLSPLLQNAPFCLLWNIIFPRAYIMLLFCI